MRNKTTLAILALVVFDAIVNTLNEVISSSTKENPPTTEPNDSSVRICVDRETFGEEELVSFLVDECGLNLKGSYADYPPTAKMMAMSTDEVRQIKEYCNSLKKKAELGEKVLKNMKMLMADFS